MIKESKLKGNQDGFLKEHPYHQKDETSQAKEDWDHKQFL